MCIRDRGWVAANDGNVSVKLEDGTFFATPTGMSKSFITPDKLVRINDKGEVLELSLIHILFQLIDKSSLFYVNVPDFD